MGIQLPDMNSAEDFLNGVNMKSKYGECSRCLDLEDKIKKANEKCKLLEVDIAEQKNVVDQLEVKLGFVELQKLKSEDGFSVLKQRNEVLETSIRDGSWVSNKDDKGANEAVDLTEADDEEEKLMQLMTENKILECEKKAAEHETHIWKVKCKELEMQVLKLQRRLLGKMAIKGLVLPELDATNMNLEAGPVHVVSSPVEIKSGNNANVETDATGTPPINVISKMHSRTEEAEGSHSELNITYGRQVRKCLSFDEKISLKSYPPKAPGGMPPFDAIDICDSDDNLSTPNLGVLDRDEDDVTCNRRNVTCLSTPKRRKVSNSGISASESEDDDATFKRGRVSNVITSESASEDGGVTIFKRRKNMQSPDLDSNLNRNSLLNVDHKDKSEESKPKRRLITQGYCEKNHLQAISPTKALRKSNSPGISKRTAADEDEQKDDSDSEGESLGGFIVSDSEVSGGDISSIGDEVSTNGNLCAENSSSCSLDYREIISGLRRDGKHKTEWDFEADMLADFGKHPEVCMKAVCALYRQQTSEEKSCKVTITQNGRGFSQCDAFRGSTLAEFLTEGDPQHDVKKSVNELLKFNPEGVELCKELASRYSKQLFAMYWNEEDPFFRPP